MKTLINVSLILVIILVTLSAYIRLSHSGIGCADWPACYGRIGEVEMANMSEEATTSYQDIVQLANEPLAWATPLHRFVASTLGLLIVFLAFAAFRNQKQRLISLSLVGLTVYLAVLGIRSGSLTDPAVIVGNLVGGFIMLGLLGWLAVKFNSNENTQSTNQSIKGLAIFSIFLLSVQILLGGLTSANFAATACQTLPDCHGSWLPDSHLFEALDLSREYQTNEFGIVKGGAERTAIHKLHRIGAIVTMLILLFVGVAAVRSSDHYKLIGKVIIVVVVLEFSIGVLAVMSALPISLAVMHNWLAGILLLALLWLLRRSIGSA